MRHLDHFLGEVERWGVGLGLAVCLLVVGLGATARWVLSVPPAWPDEASTYLFLVITFLGASASVRDDSERKVNLLYEASPGLRVPLELILHTVRIAAALVVICIGWNFVKMEWEFSAVSPVLQIPVPVVFGVLPLFGCLLVLRSFLRLLSLANGE